MWSYFVFITDRWVAFPSWIRRGYNGGNKVKEDKLREIEEKEMFQWSDWLTEKDICQWDEKNLDWRDS